MKLSEFVAKDELCSFVKKMESNDFSQRKNLINKELYSVENLIECSRKIYYRSVNAPIINQNYDKEVEVKRKWVSIFSNADKEVSRLIVSNCEISDINTHLTGYIDSIVLFPLKEIKTIMTFRYCNETEISYISEYGPYRRHILANQALMHLADMNRSMIIYDNLKSDPEIFNIDKNEAIQSFINNKISTIKNQTVLGMKPERPYSDSESKECKICPFKEMCWR